MTDGNFPADGEEKIEQAVRARLGSTDEIVVELVDDIEPSPSGKYRPLVSKVSAEMIEAGKFTLKN